MRVPNDHPLQQTYTLRNAESALSAIQAMHGGLTKAQVEALVEVVYTTQSARIAVAAIAALDSCDSPLAEDARRQALESSDVSVRMAALMRLSPAESVRQREKLQSLLAGDSAWIVRRAAVRALTQAPSPDWCSILTAASDPHWRVRHALAQALLCSTKSDGPRQHVEPWLEVNHDSRSQGLLAYIRWRWSAEPPQEEELPPRKQAPAWCEFWDWDATVFHGKLTSAEAAGRADLVDMMPKLLGHDDERIRRLAIRHLLRRGQAHHLAEALSLLDEPRHAASGSAVELAQRLNLDQVEDLVDHLLRSRSLYTPSALAWAIDRLEEELPAKEFMDLIAVLLADTSAQAACVRHAIARLATRFDDGQLDQWLAAYLDSEHVHHEVLEGLQARNGKVADSIRTKIETHLPRWMASDRNELRTAAVQLAFALSISEGLALQMADDQCSRVRRAIAEHLAKAGDVAHTELLNRLQQDHHPRVRAEALTLDRARELITIPALETSWHVLAQAARMCKLPLWELEPEAVWNPSSPQSPVSPVIEFRSPTLSDARKLGSAGLEISPIGISGHYGLPVQGFAQAVEMGVNLMFWEPNYQTLTEFVTRLPARPRAELHLTAGTFEADGKHIRRDLERTLRQLKVEQLSLFMLFWVQSWDRITDEVRATLDSFIAEGRIRMYGLSTHSRQLAMEAIHAGWNPIMVRHSAAHRGAEQAIFPAAAETATSIITFNNTCYGRLLRPSGDSPLPAAADCYRYTLAQAGVTACWSAPSTIAQLEENLQALKQPWIDDVVISDLRRHGDLVYREDKIFEKCVRFL